MPTKIPPKTGEKPREPVFPISNFKPEGLTMRWKWLLREYFHFSRKERIAILTLLVLLLIITVLPYYCLPSDYATQSPDDTRWMGQLNEQLAQSSDADAAPVFSDAVATSSRPASGNTLLHDLVPFDPNTLPETGWLSFGLRPKTVSTIIRYREKGGRFRRPEDLERIYGLLPAHTAQLIPYVRIAAASTPPPYPDQRTAKTPVAIYTKPVLDINTADSAAWESLPGIGPKLAGRIIRFRETLGGFHTKEQLAEVFGLPDSVYQKNLSRLHCRPEQQFRISINQADVETLGRHPYIRKSLAVRVVAFRNMHGSFASLQSLLQIHGLDSLSYHRMLPYLQL